MKLLPIEENITTPKSFKLKEIAPIIASRLNGIWHSRLPIIKPSNIIRNKNYICFGLFIDELCYGIAIWSSPVSASLDFKSILELRRMALSPNCPKNTATWFLSKCIKQIKIRFPQIIKLISYQDTLVHKGTIYSAGNWKANYKTKFSPWTTKRRKRNIEQAPTDKVRWEYELKRYKYLKANKL
jgi:hypothetical protein